MFRFISILIFFTNIIYAQARLAEVSGNVFLSDQTDDHSGVKVIFEAASSSATTDSTISNNDGLFAIGLNDGIYLVHFSKSGYIPYTLPNSFTYAGGSYTINDVTLVSGSIIEVSGRVKGNWSSDFQYRVVDDINVTAADTLVIEAGTNILFMDEYIFEVSGSLIAVGTEEDSIYFTSGQPQRQAGDWQGIKIFESSNYDHALSRVITLQYCDVSFGGNGMPMFYDYKSFNLKNLIAFDSNIDQDIFPKVNIYNCHFYNSSSQLFYSELSRVNIENSTFDGYRSSLAIDIADAWYANFSNNEVLWSDGVSDYLNLFHFDLNNSNYDGHQTSKKFEVKNNFFKTYRGMGYFGNNDIYSSSIDSLIIENNIFTAIDYKYPVNLSTKSNNYTIFSRNIVTQETYEACCATGIQAESNDKSIIRNNYINNHHIGIEFQNNSETVFENNILDDLRYGIDASGNALQVSIQNNIINDTRYEMIYNNQYANLPTGLTDVMTINANGDSVDTYGNLISVDPLYAPSDSTIVFQYDINNEGIIKFDANPNIPYFSDVIGDGVNSARVSFYEPSIGQFNFQLYQELIPVSSTQSYQNFTLAQNIRNTQTQIQLRSSSQNVIKRSNLVIPPNQEKPGPNISNWTLDEYSQITPSNRRITFFDGESNAARPSHMNTRNTEQVSIFITVDSWPEESSWNIYDYANQTYYYSSNQTFPTDGNVTYEQTVDLEVGLYSIDVWDTYGDGGLSGTVYDASNEILVSWTSSDYGSFGEFEFFVGGTQTLGCTDINAYNYDAEAELDDGSCLYDGDQCDLALVANNGTNASDGGDEYFKYTALSNGILVISSLSLPEELDTRVYVYESCDDLASGNWIYENDDYQNSLGSFLEFQVEAGQEYIIFWSSEYGPGPFQWSLIEGAYGENWTTTFDFFEYYSDRGKNIEEYSIRFNNKTKYFYSSNFHSQPSRVEYLSYTLNLSPQSPAIDAGNPDPTLYDPDGTISDIGKYYFDQGNGGQVAAPVADFSTSSVSGSYPLYVEFTSTSSGAINTYTWNFGDGSISNSTRPVHLYTSAGMYSVSLTVTGPGGEDTMVKTDLITVASPSLPPVVSFSAEPTAGILPLEVVFSSSITNDVESVLWNFGDGATSTELNPTHTYNAIGSYTVSFTATNSYGTDVETKEAYINVIGPEEVIAGFDVAPKIGIAPMEVSFINESIGTIESILWDFGNGGSSDQLSPIYTYDSPGIYDVSMIAYGTLNNDTIQEFDFINVYDKRPIISSIVDIPNDQGGQVLLRWNPSGWDGPVGSKITQYSLWEDYNGEWININNAMANQSDSYTFLANTFADSNSESVNWSRFKVLAHTNEPGVFYESPVDSGFSIDNVPPATPSAVLATISSNGIDLEWGEVNESNFMYYNLYRNGEKIAELTDQVYTDFNLGTQTPSYYQVTAVDDGGNESEPTPETVVDATDLAWFINIRGSMIGGESDLFNFIGVSEDATADFDEGFDIFEPPMPPSNYLAISFPLEELETILGDELAQDIHKDIVLADTMHVWHMNAISNVSDSAVFYFDMANVPDVPIIVEHIASGQRAHLADSSWFGVEMIADSLYQFKISIGDTTSPVLAMHQNVNGPRILHSDSSYVFSWDIADGNGLDSVFAYASTDSGYSYNLISAWSGYTDTLIYTIPDTTLATGCMIQVHGRDYAGNHITKQSEQVFAIVGDNLSVSVDPGWSLWGAPMVPYVGNMADNLEEEINGYWYTYGFENGGYTFDSTLSIGHGYWLATLDAANVGIHGMPLSDDYSQSLNIGWNIISNPLVLDVSVDSLTFDKDTEILGYSEAIDAGWINTIYSYDNLGYEMPSILNPWTGYWISVLDSGVSVTYPIHKGVESSQPARMVMNESSWNISFEASIDGAVDRLTVMGVAEDATNGFDPEYDIAEAPNPPGGEYVTMSTYHQDWPTVLGERYSKDVKSPVINGGYNEWIFTIETSSDEVEITWLFEDIPDEYEIGYNYTDGMFFADMRAIESLVVPNGSELIVRVGAELLATEPSDLLPQVYSLHQNYPNPFNPVTSIYFDVPKAGNVNISVYDMLGRKIKTLVNEHLNPGFLNVQWNATNELSQPVSAGVYIYTIEAGSFRQTRKMILLK